MNRRSVLRWLGLAPVAAPAAVAAASAPALPPIDYSGLAADVSERTRVAFEVRNFVIRHPNLPEGHACITSETEARASADAALSTRIDGAIARIG